jgi:class 3 adenylate cyclase
MMTEMVGPSMPMAMLAECAFDSAKSSIKEQFLQSTQDVEKSRYHVMFSAKQVSYCIGLVDMVDSTKLAASMGMQKMSKYYQHFLNLMSKVIFEFDGQVIKNVGDCLMFYFPKVSTSSDESTIRKSIECSIAMTELHDFLCSQMKLEGLPCIDYRISLDYGYVMPMRTSDSELLDMIGPAVNMCSKINHLAEKNSVVIGGDLYEIVKHFGCFSFKEVKGYSIGLKHTYPTYLIR